jgi:ectoine hydroxylase-related dioxygenase (phytanoyl-CoA dioxygenase family)
MYNELKETGICFLRNQIDDSLIEDLRNAVGVSFLKHRNIQIALNNEIDSDGVALNVFNDDFAYVKLLEKLMELGVIKDIENNFFKSKFILNSISALDNKPNSTNFSAIVHRDIKFFSKELPIMLNALVLLDDFTVENGATMLLPNSHKIEEKPTDFSFIKNCVRAVGKKGDILLFNSNIWHCSAPNKTNESRRAIPMTFSKSCMKQMLDYTKSIETEVNYNFSDDMKQLLGFDSRVPSSLYEWYLPVDKRFYKKNQD